MLFEQKINSQSLTNILSKHIKENPYSRAKYKEILIYRIKALADLADKYLEEGA